MSPVTTHSQAVPVPASWGDRNPQHDSDPRIRDAYRDLYPSQSEDIPSGGGYNEETDGPTTVGGGFHPRRTVTDVSERAFLTGGGWGVIDAKADYSNSQRRGGITFREPEQGEFYVDGEELLILLEQELGFTIVDFKRCWTGTGRRSAETKAQADRIARRLARMSTGLGVVQLAALMDVHRRSLHRAITRGRELLKEAA